MAMLGFATAWNAGNIGPVASELAAEFDTSLAAIGLLSGTVYFLAAVLGILVAAQAGERLGLIVALRISLIATIAGNVLIAITPIAGGVAAGRVLAALSLAWVPVLAPVWARQVGGIRLIGYFGASFQLGIAGALAVGAVLSEVGIDYRLGFVISAALAAVALVTLHGLHAVSAPLKKSAGFLRAAAGSLRVYRLALLFISIYGVPMVLGAWLVAYLTAEGGVAIGVAGVLAFLLFATSAGMRVAGGRFQTCGVPHPVLAGTLGLAALGMFLLVIEQTFALALPATLALGVGVAIPYTLMLIEAQKLFPAEPAEPVALLTLIALLPPILAIPLVGMALDSGDGELALGALAVFLVVATLANLRPTGRPVANGVGDIARQPD
jgi:MFS family permease